MTETNVGVTEESRPTRRATLSIVVLAALLVGIIGVALAVNGHRDAYAAPQIGRMEQSCEQWASTAEGPSRPDVTWCRSMASWMNAHMGQTTPGFTTGAMMWQSPDNMQQTCQEWMTENATSSTNPAAPSWCQQMVGWMTTHMGDWDDWMMNGSMMGGR
jgi:hypothetical protein